MVAGLGGLLLVDAVGGALRGAVGVAGPGGILGLALVAAGASLALGARVGLAATALCFLAAVLMADRLHRTQRLLPALPVGVLAVALGYAVFSERRRLLGHTGASRAPRAPGRGDG